MSKVEFNKFSWVGRPDKWVKEQGWSHSRVLNEMRCRATHVFRANMSGFVRSSFVRSDCRKPSGRTACHSSSPPTSTSAPTWSRWVTGCPAAWTCGWRPGAAPAFWPSEGGGLRPGKRDGSCLTWTTNDSPTTQVRPVERAVCTFLLVCMYVHTASSPKRVVKWSCNSKQVFFFLVFFHLDPPPFLLHILLYFRKKGFLEGKTGYIIYFS